MDRLAFISEEDRCHSTAGYNVRKKEVAKEEYHEQLKNKVNRIWKTRTEVVPIVMGAMGIVTTILKMCTNVLQQESPKTLMITNFLLISATQIPLLICSTRRTYFVEHLVRSENINRKLPFR